MWAAGLDEKKNETRSLIIMVRFRVADQVYHFSLAFAFLNKNGT